jgi:type VI secretion system protein ImpH
VRGPAAAGTDGAAADTVRAAPTVPGAGPAAKAPPAPENGPPAARGVIEQPRVVSLEKQLFAEPYCFDFFQAVRLLERVDRGRRPVGLDNPPAVEAVRFRAHISLNFPPSSIYDLERPPAGSDTPPVMTVAFMGLHGPSGVLPRHYTELMSRLAREAKHKEKWALRDWFDLFNHRFIALFYRAWEKYRFYIPYERGDYAKADPDPFTRCLFSLVGMGQQPLRSRLRVSVEEEVDEERRRRDLARIDDLALLHYSGLLAHRPRNAQGLQALLNDYFMLPVRLKQFQGQWLNLEPASQSQLGEDCNNEMGVSLVAGTRVWDTQSKFRLRLGPLSYAEFTEFLPDRSPLPERKAFFVLSHLTRLYAGPDLDFDVQLILRARDVPECQLDDRGGGAPRLGWNTWIRSRPMPRDAEDAVFDGADVVWVGERLPL